MPTCTVDRLYVINVALLVESSCPLIVGVLNTVIVEAIMGSRYDFLSNCEVNLCLFQVTRVQFHAELVKC